MSKKILNTMRGSGKNTIERAGKLTLYEIRKKRELEHRLKLCYSSALLRELKELENDQTCEKIKRKNRTMLWP